MSKRTTHRYINAGSTIAKKNLYFSMLDIVIPVYGMFDFLGKCLPLLAKAVGGHSFKIILVDNCSPEKEEADQFYAQVLKDYSNLSVHRLKENKGFAAGCNYGADKGRSKYIVFLNSDAFMEENSLGILIDDMEQEPKIGLIGPKLLFSEDSPNGPIGTIQHAGLNFNIRAGIDHTFIGWRADHSKANIPCEVDALTGACLMVPRKLFNEAGRFFLGYGLGTWEDVDLALTISQLGYKIVYEPKSVGHHYVGGSVINHKMSYPIQQNQQLFHMRWASKIPWTVWKRV